MLKKSFRYFVFLLFVVTAISTSQVLADEPVPAWMQTASKQQIPTYEKDVPGVVLNDEQIVTVNSEGNLSTTTYYAVKILIKDGKSFADAAVPYLQSSSKVREMKAWLIRADGTVKFYGKDKIIDRISDPDDIYDENRVKIVDASDEADAGAIFGYQSTVEEKPLFHQDRWAFQGRLPTLVSRYTLNLPNGWNAQSITFNRPQLDPTVNGTSYTWELRDLSPIPPEPSSPLVRNLAPRIAVSYSPNDSGAGVYKAWQNVSQWYSQLSESSLTIDDAIAGKARELTANSKTELEKIRAIANFVQNLRYISLQIDVAHGGGHRPRPANLVLQRGFGDCKDKANLMRALLKSLKIESYLVLIFAGDPTYVRAEWASPNQFNHCIIAINVSPETKASTVIDNPKLGRLLIFDSTDPYTQIGDLPEHEQGSFALIAAGDNGDLVKMPVLSPELNKLERRAEVSLTETGGLTGTISEHSVGQASALERAYFRISSPADYNKRIESWISRGMSGAQVVKIVPSDTPTEGKFDLSVDFKVAFYGQVMQNRLLVFKPALVGRLDRLTFTESKRFNSIILDSEAYSETVKVSLPKGFIVDEMPDAVNIETPFGKYTANYEVKDEQLLFTRSLTLLRTSIPADKYDLVKNFFGKIRAAEQSPVVLLRK